MLWPLPAAEATPAKEGSIMTQESLQDRVQAAIYARLREIMPSLSGVDAHHDIAEDLTRVAFAELAGARPCVTCGKSIGPAKVAKGYVQCYGCRGTTIQDRAEMRSAHDARPALPSLGDLESWIRNGAYPADPIDARGAAIRVRSYLIESTGE